jgi:hypothetical protein
MIETIRSHIAIRKLQPYESLLYRSIRLNCLKNASDYFGSTYEEEVNTPKLKFESYIQKGGDEHFMFGAFDDENFIGIVGFDRVERKRVRHRGDVVQMYMDAAHRGRKYRGETAQRIGGAGFFGGRNRTTPIERDCRESDCDPTV